MANKPGNAHQPTNAVELLLPAMEDLLNALEDSVVIFDKEWRYVFVNKKGWEVLGRPKQEVMGKNVWELLPEMAGSKFEKTARDAMKRQIHMEIQEFYPHLNEYYRTKFYPTSTSLAVYITDITDLVLAENMNHQLMGDLKEAMEVYWSEENSAMRHKNQQKDSIK